MLTEAVVSLLLLLFLYLATRRPQGIPPGKWGWPVIGSPPPKDGLCLADQVRELQKKHGDIISWRMGSQLMIFLCNFKLIKEAFNKLEFTDRPDFFSFKVFVGGEPIGIVMSNGQTWQVHRRFALRNLKDLGMGKNRMESAIQYEASCLVDDFKQRVGLCEVLPWSINVSIVNVIWKLVADWRFEVGDQKAQEFNQLVSSTVADLQGNILLFDLFPWLIPITPSFVKKWMGVEFLQQKSQQILSYMNTFIEQHKATLNPDNPRDLIDEYLIEEEAQKDNQGSEMTRTNLVGMIADLFGAGSETTSSTIRWSILYLTKYPEIQARVQQEIDQAVPRGTLPSLQDKDRLPYFQATLQELHRLVSLVPMGVAHVASQDTQLGGYMIPKGSVIMPHQECCHKDPECWEKPDEFYPEHFLDAENKFVNRKDNFLPFSVGRRQCVGESMARMELFGFLSALLQNFTFTAVEGDELSVLRDPRERIINIPKPFRVIIKERE